MYSWKLDESLQAFPAGQTFHRSSGRTWLRPLLLGCLAAVLFSPCAGAQNAASSQATASSNSSEAYAIFDGQPIYEDQLPASEQAQLQRMMLQVFAVRHRALQEVLDQKLVEAEAKKKGVTVDDLAKSEVDSKVPDPTDDEVSAYYQAHQGQINQPFDQVKDKIRQGLKDQAIQKARAVYLQGLMEQAVNDGELVLLLRPPKAPVTPDPGRLRGDPKAPVTIVEFADFSCPYCRKVEPTLSELLAKYPGKVNLGFRDFPLRQIHPQAQLAAEASRCAGEQGKYWEYHDLLFANPDKQGRDDLMADAVTLKMDDKQFDACLSSGRYKPQIEEDIQIGTRVGIVDTPGFFINGTFLNGAQPAEAFEKIIDQELASTKQRRAAN
jgi:protein-disulfide isomerase